MLWWYLSHLLLFLRFLGFQVDSVSLPSWLSPPSSPFGWSSVRSSSTCCSRRSLGFLLVLRCFYVLVSVLLGAIGDLDEVFVLSFWHVPLEMPVLVVGVSRLAGTAL